MNVDEMALKRIDILKNAVAEVLSTTLQSQEAGKNLEKAFPNCRFNDSVSSTERILANLTKGAIDNALSAVDNLLTQDNIKETLNAIDENFVATATLENENVRGQIPASSLPKATWTEIAVSCKKKELEKLNIVLREKERIAAELQSKVNGQVQEVGAMRAKVTGFSDNAEEVFHMSTDS